MKNRTQVSLAIGAAFSAGLVGLSPGVLAQQQLERVEVTGSRVKRIDAETASPVQIITREDIERTGKTSIQEILRTVTADSNGTIPTSFTNGFASGSAAVSLRGLGVNSTLVLVNGRRMSTYGLADDGTRNFVDLNSLPLEAVDRIEVLKDGASAIYGADAVGGVVNVILRRNYTGASVGASYGQTGNSDGQDMRAYGSYGFGNLETDKYNVFFTLEASKTKNILSTDRGFIGQVDLRDRGYFDTTNGASRPYFGLGPTSNSPFGVTRTPPGVDARVNVIPCPGNTDPATGLCRFNRFTDQEVQPETERLNLFGRGTMNFTQTLTGYAELGFFNTKTKAAGTLGANNDAGVYVPGDPFNPLLVHGPMTLPANHPDNTFGVDRTYFTAPYELGGRDQETNNKVFRGLVGLQGSNYGWDWDTGLLYAKSTLKNDNLGFIIWDQMQAALNNGTYRINRSSLTSPSPTNPAVLAAISPTLSSEPTSSVTSLDFKASRELMQLTGGPLGLALGAEIRREKADDPGVPGTETGSIVGLGYSKFSMSRDVYAMYGEVVAPVAKWLELNAALRYDHYSDFGNSVTPKVGFKARPTDQFMIRGTYAEAFRAPGPAEVGGSSFGFTTFGILSQGNPDIQPEEAKSYTLGFVSSRWPAPASRWTSGRSIARTRSSRPIPTRSSAACRRPARLDENLGRAAEHVHLLRRGRQHWHGHRFLPERREDEDGWLRLLRAAPHEPGRQRPAVGAGVLDARQQARAHRRIRQLARLRRHPRASGAQLRHRGAEGPRHGDADLGPWTGGVDPGHQLRGLDHDGGPQG